MKEYTVDYITNLTKKVNELRNELYKCMKWGGAPQLSEGDVRMVLEVESD